jgi:DNA-binding CsgD family transcriptional regulator
MLQPVRDSRGIAAPGSERLAPLTSRERSVLEHAAGGARTIEIAERLGISEPTVKSHLSRIYRKLGVRNRVEAANVYLLHRD